MQNSSSTKSQLHKLGLLIKEFQEISGQLHAKQKQLSSKIKNLQH